MTLPGFEDATLREAFDALRRDLIEEGGPRISTMRNYRFAILQYRPADEFTLRLEAHQLRLDLAENGWTVVPISLQELFLARIKAQGPEWAERIATMEERVAAIEPERGLNYLKSKVTPLIEGPNGIAADCSRLIAQRTGEHPDSADRTVAIVSRAGALYPFIRTSALLRHLDGQTQNVPVILLYPGERRGATGLSFMGVLNADNDYRPRIY